MQDYLKYGLFILIFIIIILFFWCRFNNNNIKEGATANLQLMQIGKDIDNYKVTDYLPDTSKNPISIKTESDFIDFIENMYKSVVQGSDSESTTTLKSKITRNIESMILISNTASQSLQNITEKSFNELNNAYPSMIQSQTDVIKLYELYYATTSMKVYFNNSDDIDLAKNPTMYNSQLNSLEKVIETLQHFHKKILLSPKHDPIIVDSDLDLDTKFYRKDHIDIYINKIKKYNYPVTQRMPKKAKSV